MSKKVFTFGLRIRIVIGLGALWSVILLNCLKVLEESNSNPYAVIWLNKFGVWFFCAARGVPSHMLIEVYGIVIDCRSTCPCMHSCVIQELSLCEKVSSFFRIGFCSSLSSCTSSEVYNICIFIIWTFICVL